MKRFALFLGVILLLFSCTSKKPNVFTIQGNITGVPNGKAYLEARRNGMLTIADSTDVTNGSFTFKGSVPSPSRYYIVFGHTRAYFPLFIENSDISVSGDVNDLSKVAITGSKTEDEYQAYLREAKPIDDNLNSLYRAYDSVSQAGNEVAAQQLDIRIDSAEKIQLNFLKKYITDHSSSIVGPYLASTNSYMFDLDVLEPMVKAFSPSLAGSEYVKDIQNRVAALQTVAIGKQAPEFTMTDTAGNPVSLASFKGKYVLVDFWASWCGPCRAENPNVVALYNEYHNKGFTVLGVSLDSDRNSWINAIHKDKLEWAHVSDLKRWNNAAARLYAVNAIPSNVLINPEGVIIARNLRGKDLQNKLKEIL
jgi:peroxiredoxin